MAETAPPQVPFMFMCRSGHDPPPVIVIRMELWPNGDSRRLQHLEVATMTHLDARGPECRYVVRRGVAAEFVHVRSDGAWTLLERAIAALDATNPVDDDAGFARRRPAPTGGAGTGR